MFAVRGCFLIIFFSFLFSTDGRGQSIIAYYSGNAKTIDQYPVNKLTHIIFSFCHLKGNRLHVSSAGDSATIKKLVSLKVQQPSLKILLSLGGWGGCKTCSGVFSNVEGREAFARSALELTEYFHTDGIDIDWEFPALEAYPGHPFSAADKSHLTALLQSLRNALGKSKEISLIAAAFSPYLQQSIDWPAVSPIVDRINLMTYDMIGSRNKLTGHHTPLYSTPWQEESADHAVKYLDSMHISHNKIAIGSAFYARQFNDVPDKDNGLHQPGRFERFLSMKQLRRSYNATNGYNAFWDDEAQAPYSYNASKKIFLTYDDERSVAAKAAYVIREGLNGIMFWELRLDRPKNGLHDVIYNAFHSQRK